MSNQNNHSDEQFLSEVYQSTRGSGPDEGPSAALDAAILAQAEDALTTRRKRPVWLAPVGLAATVLLGVNLAVGLKDRSEEADFYREAVRASEKQAAPRPIVTPRAENAMPEASARRDAELSEQKQSATRKREAVEETASRQQASEQDDRVTGVDADQNVETYLQTPPAASAPTASSPATEPHPTTEEADTSPVVAAQPIAPSPAPPAKPVVMSGSANEPLSSDASQSSASLQPTTLETRVTTEAGSRPESAGTPAEGAEREVAMIATADAPAATLTDENSAQMADDLQEVVVTGSRIPARDDSPHRRLTAKEQALNNQVRTIDPRQIELTNTINRASKTQPAPQPVYRCDFDALEINEESIELAKVEALTFQPPLNAVSWPSLIVFYSNTGKTSDACAHLAAFRQLFPDLVLPQPLPVELPPTESEP